MKLVYEWSVITSRRVMQTSLGGPTIEESER